MEIHTKASVYSRLPKVNRLSQDEKTSVTTAPKIPVIQTSRRITEITVEIRFSSPVAFASEIFFMALVPNPKLVSPATRPVVEVSNPTIPIPDGPSNIATNFERITEMMI
ncbi:hypothetical protein SDC9_143316 [bioreactor metagenome]|uniref:Uncharacterized protein n=1 Tax=bioreactor metagenome TaxID=1076179 RepID=A0A645E3N9_9ZZZZ